jgi:ribose transport system substrate-binding protein
VAQADTQGQIERALDKTTKILKQHEDVDVIMALNDPTAMGALAAIDSIRYDWNVSVYGVDGSPEAKKLIQEGLMSGTAAQAPRKMGDSAVSTAYKILEDETYEKNQSISVEMVTEDNIDQFDISRWQ